MLYSMSSRVEQQIRYGAASAQASANSSRYTRRDFPSAFTGLSYVGVTTNSVRQRSSRRGRAPGLGVESKRLDTVSYGETKPAVRGHEESSWKLNRRSEIGVEDRHASMN